MIANMGVIIRAKKQKIFGNKSATNLMICLASADMLQLAEYLDKKGCFCLPCDVGTELFLSDYLNAHHRLKEYKFCGNRIAVVIDCWEWQRTCVRWLEDFGKTIFLTRKEFVVLVVNLLKTINAHAHQKKEVGRSEKENPKN